MKNVLNFCSDEGKVSILKFANLGGLEVKTYKPLEGSDTKRRVMTIITAHGPVSENIFILDFEEEGITDMPSQATTVTPEAYDTIYAAINNYMKTEPLSWMTLYPKAGFDVENVNIIIRRTGIVKIVHDTQDHAVFYVTNLGFTIKLDAMTPEETQASINDWLSNEGEVNQLIYPSEDVRSTMKFKRRPRPENPFDNIRDLMEEFKNKMEEDPIQFDDNESSDSEINVNTPPAILN